MIGLACSPEKPDVLTFTVDPRASSIEFFWKDEDGTPMRSLGRLRKHVESRRRTLRFAMNGGMFDTRNVPVGLYVENGIQMKPLNTHPGKPDKYGRIPNFHMQPNGVFYITQGKEARICTTGEFPLARDVKYATQSGPMLLIDSVMNSAFKKGSHNRQIRNGVGIDPNGRVVFAMSKGRISFYDFAEHFLALGCKYALYLDGYVSKTYSPEQDWTDAGGDFGVMIGVIP